jgi:Putative Flp pilus-assembly TadE/G-like
MATYRGHRGGPRQGGQALVVMVLALVALLAGVALVIDSGNAFAQQRGTQNAVDSAANAGSIVLMNDVVANSNGQTLPATDAAVLSAVNLKASDNNIAPPTAYYTTITGQCILADGTSAAPPCGSGAAATAVRVGSAPGGSIPTVKANANGKQCPLPPNVASTTPALACGVAVYGSRAFGTYFASIIGMNTLTASANATAVAGALTTLCAADQPCSFLPIAFPTTLTLCDGSGKQVDFNNNPAYTVITSGDLTSTNELIIGICGSGDGTVGWLQIQPEDSGTGCNGSMADLICDILVPDNPALPLPVWIQTVSGNTNDAKVDAAINTYAGDIVGTYESGKDKTVIIPLYDCIGSKESQTSTDTCAEAAGKQGGTNIYFHVTSVISFVLDHAYVNASNPECNQSPGLPHMGGNGKNGCLKGWLVNLSTVGPIGVGSGQPNTVFGVQLIR